MNVARAVFETMMSVFAILFIVGAVFVLLYMFIVALINGNPTVITELDLLMEFQLEVVLVSFLFLCFIYKSRVIFGVMFQELDKALEEAKHEGH